MTYQEARQWFSYIAKRGSLNIGRRLEQSAAVMLYSWFRSHGTNAEIEDFMPHEDREPPAPEEPADIHTVFNLLRATSNGKPKPGHTDN